MDGPGTPDPRGAGLARHLFLERAMNRTALATLATLATMTACGGPEQNVAVAESDARRCPSAEYHTVSRTTHDSFELIKCGIDLQDFVVDARGLVFRVTNDGVPLNLRRTYTENRYTVFELTTARTTATFADGHSEINKWVDTRQAAPTGRVVVRFAHEVNGSNTGRIDVAWYVR